MDSNSSSRSIGAVFGFLLLAVLAAESTAEVVVTDSTRLLYTTDLGNHVYNAQGVFSDSITDGHGTAFQDSVIDGNAFAGLLGVDIDTDDPVEDKQIVSQMLVDFTVTTPQLVTLTVPTLSSDISNPAPTVFTNGALLALGDGLLDSSNYSVFLFDNGGDYGQLNPPLDAFDSDSALSGLSDSFVLGPGEYALGVQQVVTASQQSPGVGSAITEFEITFSAVPEPATAALLSIGGVLGLLLVRRQTTGTRLRD
ncbi:PEP-CTERM sorting domain-containing protein [Aeoliella sp.]|uniref:PEP-CTERM sorting domain-containing protein n=1 Tax=Aeoliella sp. TaxID=2795800 RepID=UPI003CCC1772